MSSWFSGATSFLSQLSKEETELNAANASWQRAFGPPTPLNNFKSSSASSSSANSAALPKRIPIDYRINPHIIEFVNALAEHESTFLSFPKDQTTPSRKSIEKYENDNKKDTNDSSSSSSSSSRAPLFELTPFEEYHAREILAASPALARLRYRLCPSQLRESDFWRVYFVLLGNLTKRLTKQFEDSNAIPCDCEYHRQLKLEEEQEAEERKKKEKKIKKLDFDEIDRLCGVGKDGVGDEEETDGVDSDAEPDELPNYQSNLFEKTTAPSFDDEKLNGSSESGGGAGNGKKGSESGNRLDDLLNSLTDFDPLGVESKTSKSNSSSISSSSGHSDSSKLSTSSNSKSTATKSTKSSSSDSSSLPLVGDEFDESFVSDRSRLDEALSHLNIDDSGLEEDDELDVDQVLEQLTPHSVSSPEDLTSPSNNTKNGITTHTATNSGSGSPSSGSSTSSSISASAVPTSILKKNKLPADSSGKEKENGSRGGSNRSSPRKGVSFAQAEDLP